jgi:acetyl esterase/lipase
MIFKTIPLKGDNAYLNTYLLDDGEYETKNRHRKAVIVCPGGGYSYCSRNEGEPVALFYARHGFHAFVLNYDCGIKHPFPTQLRQLAEAFLYVRSHQKEWLIDEIDVVGFSAGGNLALSLGCFFDKKEIIGLDLPTKDYLRPDHIIVGYPAITLHPTRPEGEIPPETIELIEKGLIADFRGPTIREILLGKEKPTEEEKESLNLLHYLRADFPPTFVFGSYDDTIIPVSDLTSFAGKLVELKVPVELHLFAHGVHGVSLCDESVKLKKDIEGLSMGVWPELSLSFLDLVK